MAGTAANNTARFIDSIEGRNRIINGACMVQQRGSLVYTNGTTGYSGPDRWYSANGAGGQFTQSSGTITFNGVSRPAVVQTVNTAFSTFTASNYWQGIQQRIEGFNCCDLLGQQVSISFIFNTNVSGTYSVSLIDGAVAYSYLTTITAVANTPTRYTFSLPAIPTAATIPQSTAVGLFLTIGTINFGTYESSITNQWQTGEALCYSGATNWAATASNFIALAEVQLEVGPDATPFERRLISYELQQCQRYFQIFENTLYAFYTTGSYGGGANMISGVQMRVTPTLTGTNISSSGGYTGVIGTSSQAPNNYFTYFSSGATIGQYCIFELTCNAEL